MKTINFVYGDHCPHCKLYGNAQTLLPTGLKQLLIIGGKTQANSNSAPKPRAKYIEKTRRKDLKADNRYNEVSRWIFRRKN